MKETAVHWWRTVTTQEVRDSKRLVESLLDSPIGEEEKHVDALARAVAVQQLIAADATVVNLVRSANDRMRKVKLNAAGVAFDAHGVLLFQFSTLKLVFERALHLLGIVEGSDIFLEYEAFERALSMQSRIDSSLAFHEGTTRDIAPSRRLRFRSMGV